MGALLCYNMGMKNTKAKTAISLFSGCGGDTKGLEDFGYKVVGFSEINKDAVESHLANFPDSELIGDGNILNTPDSEFEKYKGVDLVFAGFPCQGFSHAGKKLPDDPRNTLFMEFVRAVKTISPSVIIGENVKGLLSRKTNSDENYIDIIVREFEELGYQVKYGLVDCSVWGIPQKRTRLFIIGTKEENPFEVTDMKGVPFFVPSSEHKVTLEKVLLDSMEGATEVDHPDCSSFPSKATRKEVTGDPHPYCLLKLSKSKDHYWNGQAYEYQGKEFDFLFSVGKRDSPIHCEVLDPKKQAKTFICSYARQPRMFVSLKKSGKTFLRPLIQEEYLSIQGFPRSFRLKGSASSRISQVGNAVPPIVLTNLLSQYL